MSRDGKQTEQPCSQCGHYRAQHSDLTGFCLWSGENIYCKCTSFSDAPLPPVQR